MKKILTSVFTLMITTLIIYSCTNNDSNENSKNSEFEKFKVLGKKHNEALNYYLKKVKETKKSELTNLLSIDGVNKTIKEFANHDNVLKNCSVSLNEGSITTCEKMFGKNIKNATKTFNKYNLKSNFSNEYIEEIINLDDYNGYILYQKKINELMFQLGNDNNITEIEKKTIYTIAAIGYSSSEYWETEGENWLLNTKKQSTNKQNPDFWKNFLKADVAGAIVGAEAGAGTGAVVVPIIGAIPGAVAGAAGGGLSTSIVWGVGELLIDSIFD